MSDKEPTVALLNGYVVLRAVFELVQRLQAEGYTITIDDRGTVSITPSVYEDVSYILESNWQDTAAVLDDAKTQPTRRRKSGLRLVPPAPTIH